MASRLFVAAFLLFTCVSVGAPLRVHAEGPPSPEPSPEARRAFEAGRLAYERGRFSEALAEYERAYSLSPHPTLLFNIGRAADSDGQVERAISAYASFLAADPASENGEFVQARLDKLRTLAGVEGSASAHEQRTEQTIPAPQQDTAMPAPVAMPAIAPAAVAAQNTSEPARVSFEPRPEQRPAQDDGATQRPTWKRAWFWIAVGAVVVTGATVGAVVATRDESARSNTDVYVTTLVAR
jgi:hypothetical protein